MVVMYLSIEWIELIIIKKDLKKEENLAVGDLSILEMEDLDQRIIKVNNNG